MDVSSSSVQDDDQGIADYFAAFQNQGEEENADNGDGVSPLSPSSPISSPLTATALAPRDEAPYPHCPIYIPSKGRGDQERGTLALLVRDLIPFTVIVEPEEADLYRQMIDHMVFTNYGAAGMSFTKEETEDDRDSKGPETRRDARLDEAGEIAQQRCACCRVGPQGSAGSDIKSENESAEAKERRQAQAERLADRRRSVAQLYHHGYVFSLPHSYVKGEVVSSEAGPGIKQEDEAEEPGSNDDVDKKTNRVPAAEFCLSSVDQVRSLFRVVELPLGQQGVSYARNYVLQVLVPADMVAAKVDVTGHADELELFGASDSSSGSGSTLNGGTRTSAGAAATNSKVYLNNDQLRTLQIQLNTTGPAGAPVASSTSSRSGAVSPAAAVSVLAPDSVTDAARLAPHNLFGYYWVMDDDIYSFFHAKFDSNDTGRSGGAGEADSAGSDQCGTTAKAKSPLQQQQGALPSPPQRKNIRVSVREMMRQVARRVEQLHQSSLQASANGSEGSGNGTPQQTTMHQRQQSLLTSFGPQAHKWSSIGGSTFTCKEDCLRNNLQPVRRQPTGGSTTANTVGGEGSGNNGSNTTMLNTANYTFLPLTACISLEYSRFAYTYDDTALAVNSYNNIACLFNYELLHTPREVSYFPSNVPGVRNTSEVLGCGLAFSPISLALPRIDATSTGEQDQEQTTPETINGLNDSVVAKLTNRGSSTSMLWYKFTVREDYDFTLQLIARGMYTLRFRNLSFDVPQMAKLRGGMTDFYKNCSDDIRWQNELFVRQWPAVAIPWVKGKNSTVRDDIRVRWDLLHPARARFPGAFLFLSQPLPQIQQQQQQGQAPPRSKQIAEQASTYDATGTAATAEEPVAAVPSAAQRPAGPVPAAKSYLPPPAPKGPSLKDIVQQQQQQQQQAARARATRPGPAVPSGVTWKGKRHWGSDSEDDDDDGSDDDGENDEEDLAQPLKAPRREHDNAQSPSAPSPTSAQQVQPALDSHLRAADTGAVAAVTAPPAGGPKHGWKGYAVERWRDLTVSEAASLGLHVLPLKEQRVGSTVAVVPTSFVHNPSCVLATLIERQTNAATGEVEWTAVAQRARGVPLLSVPPGRVYRPPEEGVEAVAQAVDAFFSNWRPPVQQEPQHAQEGPSHGSPSWLDG